MKTGRFGATAILLVLTNFYCTSILFFPSYPVVNGREGREVMQSQLAPFFPKFSSFFDHFISSLCFPSSGLTLIKGIRALTIPHGWG